MIQNQGPETISDERTIEVKDDAIFITRTMVQKFSAMDYLRQLEQIRYQVSMTKEAMDKDKEVIKMFEAYEEQAEAITQKERDAQSQELEQLKKQAENQEDQEKRNDNQT